MPRIKTITPIEDSGVPSETAEAIFEQIARFAGYGFNKSHAAAYAAISFQTAWLKTHHPEAFFASAMNLHLDKVDEIAIFINELKKRGIPIWQPSVNASRARFEPLKLKKRFKGHDFGICYGLSAIRGVGHSAAEAIENERRKSGKFLNIEDFVSRTGEQVNRTALIALAKAGAFDALGLSRAEALAEAEGKRKPADAAQLSLFDAMGAAPSVEVAEISADEVLDNEFDVLGHYMSAHPLDELAPSLVEENLYFSEFVLETSTRALRRAEMPAVVTKTDVRRTNSGDLMAVVTLSDPEGTYEALAFGESWGRIRNLAKKKARLIFDVSVSLRGDERRLIIESVRCLSPEMTRAA